MGKKLRDPNFYPSAVLGEEMRADECFRGVLVDELDMEHFGELQGT